MQFHAGKNTLCIKIVPGVQITTRRKRAHLSVCPFFILCPVESLQISGVNLGSCLILHQTIALSIVFIDHHLLSRVSVLEMLGTELEMLDQ